jgi:hypothetical protein
VRLWLGPLGMAGQLSARQCASAASSGCWARRVGFCGLPRLAEAADLPGRAGAAICELKHGSTPPTGPQLSPHAIGSGPPGPERGQAGERLGPEPARRPGVGTVA